MRRLTAFLLAPIAAAAAVAVHRFGPDWNWAPPFVQGVDSALDLTAAAGLRLDRLLVEGRGHTAAADILAAIDVERGAPILSIDLDTVRDALEALPWIAQATVERRLPDTIHVSLNEREPFALWQHDGHYALVDRAGRTIAEVDGQYGALPLIVGEGAPEHAAKLFADLATMPQLAARARAYVLIGGRRWNIHFDSVESGVVVRLPDDNPKAALDRLAVLDRDHGILNRDLEFIDLRLNDRLVVRPRTGVEAATVGGGAGSNPPAAQSKRNI